MSVHGKQILIKNKKSVVFNTTLFLFLSY